MAEYKEHRGTLGTPGQFSIASVCSYFMRPHPRENTGILLTKPHATPAHAVSEHLARVLTSGATPGYLGQGSLPSVRHGTGPRCKLWRPSRPNAKTLEQ